MINECLPGSADNDIPVSIAVHIPGICYSITELGIIPVTLGCPRRIGGESICSTVVDKNYAFVLLAVGSRTSPSQ